MCTAVAAPCFYANENTYHNISSVWSISRGTANRRWINWFSEEMYFLFYIHSPAWHIHGIEVLRQWLRETLCDCVSILYNTCILDIEHSSYITERILRYTCTVFKIFLSSFSREIERNDDVNGAEFIFIQEIIILKLTLAKKTITHWSQSDFELNVHPTG